MLNLRIGKRSAALLVLVGVIWVLALATSHLNTRETWLDGLENRLVDLRYQLIGPLSAAPEVVFVAIDDETLERETAMPNGRLLLAQVIRKIAQKGAQSLVLDVLLADAGVPEDSEALATALSQLPTVIAAAVRFDTMGQPTVIWPHETFQAEADLGLVNLQTDAAGTPRFVPLFLNLDNGTLPSMPLVAAINLIRAEARIEENSVSLGEIEVPLDAGGYMPLRLLGPAGTVRTISAIAILEDAPTAVISGKLVVLGYSATGTGDLFPTPFDDEVPGAEIIATAISQLVGGPTLRHDHMTRKWDVLHAALLTAFCLSLMLLLPLIRALPLAVFALLVSFCGLTAAFANALWMNAALPLASALPLVLLAGTLSLAQERRIAKYSEQSLTSLRRFQSPSLARQIEQDPEFLSKPRHQELAVFFVDLTGFTTLSQKLGPEGTRALLQQFHGLTGDAVQAHHGTVINFMGDGALAVFGLEQRNDARSHADLALQSAEDLNAALATVPLPADCPPATCRTGLHYGSVILSRLGAQNHQQVTVSGDTVNIASRLMEVAKAKNARIAATRDFANRLTQPASLSGCKTARIDVRGWQGEVDVVLWPRVPED